MEQVNLRSESKLHMSARRFVRVAPPSLHAGIGDALRHAYHMDGEFRSLKKFEDLLARLE